METFDRSTLQRRLEQYTNNESTVTEFYEWLMPATWELPPGTDADTVRIVGQLQLLFAEYTSGHRNGEELRSLATTVGRQLRVTAVA